METLFSKRAGRLLVLVIFAAVSLGAAESINHEQWFKFDIAAVGEKSWQPLISTDDKGLENLIINPAKDHNGKKIMVVISGQASWSDTAVKKILEVYADKQFLPQFTVIDYKKDNDLLMAYLNKAKSEKFDLLFTVGSSVLKSVYQNFKDEDIPVVSVCNKDPVLLGYIDDYQTGSNSNFAFTSVNTPIDVQIAFLKKLKPNLRNVAILVAKSNDSAMKTQFEPLKKQLLEQNINVIDIILGPETKSGDLDTLVKEDIIKQIPEVVAQLKQNDHSLENSLFWLTYSTSVVRNLETINGLSKNIPIIGVATDTVKEGDNSAVIGIGVSFKSNAYLASIYGMNILLGKSKAGELKVGVVSPPDIAISFNIARKIGFKIPFSFFENANIVYDYEGEKVRDAGGQ